MFWRHKNNETETTTMLGNLLSNVKGFASPYLRSIVTVKNVVRDALSDARDVVMEFKDAVVCMAVMYKQSQKYQISDDKMYWE